MEVPVATILPGGVATWMPLPSRCSSNIREKPRSASERVIVTFVNRSCPERSKKLCGVVLRTKITSPVGMPG